MMIISTSHTVAQALHPELFHFLRDFAPVTMIAKGPLVLAARPGFPAKTVGELVKLAKSEPGKLTYASGGGSGSAFHLCTELLQRSSGIRMLQVPYKSNAPALNDLVGGHVDLMFDMMVGIMGAVKGGQVTALAVTSEERSPALPDVPTMAEAGFPDVQVDGWWGFIVPAGTPPEAIAGIRKAVGYALAQADVQKRLAQLGAQPLGNSGEEFGKKLKAEIAMWAGVIKDAGVKPEKK
jgi:tripartite-type tricarboxylate transporter receptor subunit TctC